MPSTQGEYTQYRFDVTIGSISNASGDTKDITLLFSQSDLGACPWLGNTAAQEFKYDPSVKRFSQWIGASDQGKRFLVIRCDDASKDDEQTITVSRPSQHGTNKIVSRGQGVAHCTVKSSPFGSVSKVHEVTFTKLDSA
jgi:hypothetical protein